VNPPLDLKRFYTEVAEKYPEEEIVYSSLRGKLRRRFVMERLRKVQGTLLDLGCNRGLYMSHYSGGMAVGVDIALPALVEAKKRLSGRPARSGQSRAPVRLPAQGARPPKAYLIAGDAQNLTFLREDRFDFVLCSELLEHVFQPEKVLEGMWRVLKPGGWALVTTPNYRRGRPQWIDLGEMRHYGVRGEVYYHTAYRPEELAEMARRMGFRIQEAGTLEWEVKYATRPLLPLFWILRWLNTHLFRSRRLEVANQGLLEFGSQMIYALCRTTRLEKLLKPLITEGVRSYILIQKP